MLFKVTFRGFRGKSDHTKLATFIMKNINSKGKNVEIHHKLLKNGKKGYVAA